MRKQGGTPSRRDKHVTPAAISSSGVARGRFVGGQQSGLVGCKPPPLFTRGASSCSSQGQRQGEPWGASPRPSAPTYLPPTFTDLPQIGYILAILHTWALPQTPRPLPGTELYTSDVPDSAPLSIHCRSAAFKLLTGNHHLPRMRLRDPNRPYSFSKSDLYKSLKIDADTQLYFCSSALTFYMDWDFSLGHISRNLSSVLADLSSHGVPFVTGTNIQIASPTGCIPGLAGPEPSGTFTHLRHDLHQPKTVPVGCMCAQPNSVCFLTFHPSKNGLLSQTPQRGRTSVVISLDCGAYKVASIPRAPMSSRLLCKCFSEGLDSSKCFTPHLSLPFCTKDIPPASIPPPFFPINVPSIQDVTAPGVGARVLRWECSGYPLFG